MTSINSVTWVRGLQRERRLQPCKSRFVFLNILVCTHLGHKQNLIRYYVLTYRKHRQWSYSRIFTIRYEGYQIYLDFKPLDLCVSQNGAAQSLPRDCWFVADCWRVPSNHSLWVFLSVFPLADFQQFRTWMYLVKHCASLPTSIFSSFAWRYARARFLRAFTRCGRSKREQVFLIVGDAVTPLEVWSSTTKSQIRSVWSIIFHGDCLGDIDPHQL